MAGPRPTAGRPRKPDQVKKDQGTFRKDRENPLAPEYPVAAPDRPAWLSAEAAEEWDRLIPVLLTKRVIAAVDLGVATAYCTAVADLRIASEILKTEPRYYEVAGLRREHPASKASRELGSKVLRLASELGLSPASRSRVNAVPPDLPTGAGSGVPEDPMAPPPTRPEGRQGKPPVN